jgi:hypothetical protein
LANATEIARMSSADKIGEAMRRSLPHLPEGARALVESMLSPGSLALIAGTIAVWAGSHFFGVGEVVDVILLGVGPSRWASASSKAPQSSTTLPWAHTTRAPMRT